MNYYLLGVVVGVIFALGVFFIRLYLHKKKHPNTGKYDERQIIGRGKAFQAGFFTLLAAGALCNIWDFVSPLPGGSFVWNISVLLLGVTVFAQIIRPILPNSVSKTVTLSPALKVSLS